MKNNYKPLILFVIFFFSWLTLISSMWKYPYFLLVILILISLIYFKYLKSSQDTIVFLVAAAFGPIGEALVSKSGLWTYHGFTIFGIPPWLPVAWGITALSIFRLIKSVKKI